MAANSNNGKQSFLKGAAVLAVATVIIKILGMLYKIPLGNILGEEGTAYFNMAYSIYNVLLTLSTAGLPVALSKLVSEATALGRRTQVQRTLHVAFVSFLIFGLFGFSVMFFFAKSLASAIGDPDGWYSIMALAPAVFFVSLMSVYRGYLQGQSYMTPTAVSQVLEVLIKLIVGLALAILLIKRGFGLPIAAAGAIIGVTAGSLVTCLYLMWAKRRHERRSDTRPLMKDTPDSSGSIFARLIKLCVPITLGSSVLSIITLIDTALILRRLQSGAGFALETARGLYGCYSLMITLFNLPPAFVIPLTMSIIPAVSTSLAHGDRNGASGFSVTSLRITAAVALPAAVGMCVLSEPIVSTLYPAASAIAPNLLSLLSLASFFVCISLVSNSILQAYGKIYVPLVTMAIGGIVKVVFNWFLVGNASVNIMGAPVGTFFCYAVISALNLIYITRMLPKTPNYFNMLGRPAIGSVIMGAAAHFSYPLFRDVIFSRLLSSERIAVAAALVFAIAVGVVVYLVLAVVLRIITAEDFEQLPGGQKLVKLLHIRSGAK